MAIEVLHFETEIYWHDRSLFVHGFCVVVREVVACGVVESIETVVCCGVVGSVVPKVCKLGDKVTATGIAEVMSRVTGFTGNDDTAKVISSPEVNAVVTYSTGAKVIPGEAFSTDDEVANREIFCTDNNVIAEVMFSAEVMSGVICFTTGVDVTTVEFCCAVIDNKPVVFSAA